MCRSVLIPSLVSLSALAVASLAIAEPTFGETPFSGIALPESSDAVATNSIATLVAAADSRLLAADEVGAGVAAVPPAETGVAPPADAPPGPQATPSARPMAFEYSDGYHTRLKIHKYASYATLPLFGAQYVVGQKLYNGTVSDSTRSAHQALAAATGVLFGVNTVTGVWNMVEASKDPNHKTKRTIHGSLMLAADAGFVATGLLTPHHKRNSQTGFAQLENNGTSPSTHRSVALVSMGIATVSYLMMLFH